MAKATVLYHQAKLTPPNILLKKGFKKLTGFTRKTAEFVAISRSTYINLDKPKGLGTVFTLPNISKLTEADKERLIDRADEIVEHRFNLLGSGELEFAYSTRAPGFEGFSYPSVSPLVPFVVSQESETLRNKIQSYYKPISWNKDIISGYVWELDMHGNSIKPSPAPGVDIKQPWELGRMQHLPVLALAYHSIKDYDNNKAEKYISEFKSQVYDFRACCPPLMGVQWSSAMDVGIRMVNILIAYDFFRGSDPDTSKHFDSTFHLCIEQMCYEHLGLMTQNIEYADGQPNNHYFSNICSILIVSKYLSNKAGFNSLHKWAIRQLVFEIQRQFNSDGGNFEGSTAYHLFTTEMMLVALSTISSDNKCIAESELESINSNIRLPEGYTPYVPDRKSKTDFLRWLVDVDTNIEDTKRPYGIGKIFGNIFSYSVSIASDVDKYPRFGDEDAGSFINLDLSPNRVDKNRHYDIYSDNKSIYSLFYQANLPKNVFNLYQNGVISDAFPKSGLYRIKNDYASVWIKNSSLGLYGRGGHNHNDNLSFVLYKNRTEIITDPGTYTYTGHPDYRNLFRTTRYHNTPQIEDKEINPFGEETEELFWFRKDKSRPETKVHTEYSYIGSHKGFGRRMTRAFVLSDNLLMIKDEYPEAANITSRLHIHPDIQIRKTYTELELYLNGKPLASITCDAEMLMDEYWFSPGYGRKQIARMVLANTSNGSVNWSISL
jgi:hypothetical protein